LADTVWFAKYDVFVLKKCRHGRNEILIFTGLFSAIYQKNWWPYSHHFFRPVLCYLAGKTAIWQQ
jgi:hypothetical protein